MKVAAITETASEITKKQLIFKTYAPFTDCISEASN